MLYLSGEVGDAPLCLRDPLSHDCKQLRDSSLGTGEWNNGTETTRPWMFNEFSPHRLTVLCNISTAIGYFAIFITKLHTLVAQYM